MRNVLFVLCLLAGAFLWGAPALAQDAKFDVFEFRVEGTTLLPAAAVERAVYPHLGEQKTLADVEKARDALEKAYHASGYLTVLVNIPQQKVDGGVVKLAVTEAPVDRLRVVESRYFLPSDIRAGVPELAEGKVPNFPDMQAELTALNRSPDRRITPVLRPGKTPGTVEVDLKVQDELPLHGNVEINDRYSQDTSPTRLSANLRWDNLWNKQHSLGLTLQTSPSDPKEGKVVSANYSVPLSTGDVLALYGVESNSDVAAVGTLSVVGRGTVLGARYIRMLPGSETLFHSASFGVDYKDFDQSVELLDSGGFSTPIKYLPFTLGWDATWTEEAHTSKFGLAVNFHLQGLVGDEQAFADKRFKGRPAYVYLRGNAAQQWRLPQDYGLNARASWQLSGQPLISNEQFAIGGVDTVRGYLESAALGDQGLALSLEARTPSLLTGFPALAESVTDLHALAFMDAASVRVIDPISATDRFTLSGVGLGLGLKGWHGLDLSLVWAYPLKEVGNTRPGDQRLHFNLAFGW